MSLLEIVGAAERLIDQTSMDRWKGITAHKDIREASRRISYLDAGVQAAFSKHQLRIGGVLVMPYVEDDQIFFGEIPDISTLRPQELIAVATEAEMDFSQLPVRGDISIHVMASHIRGHVIVTLCRSGEKHTEMPKLLQKMR